MSRPTNPARGQHHYRFRLTPELVQAIRDEHFAYVRGYSRIASKYGLGESTVRDVCTYRTWRNVT